MFAVRPPKSPRASRPSNGMLASPDRRRAFRQAFLYGCYCGLAVLALLMAWAGLRAKDTAALLQANTPVKTIKFSVVSKASEKPVIASPRLTQGDGTAPDGDLRKTSSVSALSQAPIDGLFESMDGLQLPVIRPADGMTPFQAYKKPFQTKTGLIPVSIVVVDFGLSSETSKAMLDDLPEGVTFVLSPYASEPSTWAAAARAYGHELWMMLPMETAGYGKDDTGPKTILRNANPQENAARMKSLMSVATGYAGFVTEQNHILKESDKALEALKVDIASRGLALVESNKDDNISSSINKLWLDGDLDLVSVKDALDGFEKDAKTNGHVIAFVHPYPNIMTDIKLWTQQAETKGLQIAPLSAMVRP